MRCECSGEKGEKIEGKKRDEEEGGQANEEQEGERKKRGAVINGIGRKGESGMLKV